ncbi:hypothetical protein FDH48_gp50 [Arthrobacter phage Jawnski]|uniref:Uncharacterized protein n=2 Tax=Jawnskivirus TaxID=3425003 RepID=A0A0M4RB96_9CAUD|nr:hypothetical protein FDH47_gp51 [Arthrobacter phage Brent]YP_009601610.1 hypothetical protein FDH48_gp50 [Arthrobacter phage Jawnski]ALF01262.1 hypothetical protein SEA_BRENT_51 [Arthrobacter phage Brent]ALY09379.1 hypothetical protein JAWNSKI_50 [Arthrobacter phage Jawnski]
MRVEKTETTVETIINRKLSVSGGPLVKTATEAYTHTNFRVDAVTFVRREGAEPHLAIIEGFAVDAAGKPRSIEKRYSRAVRRNAWESNTYRWLNDLL